MQTANNDKPAELIRGLGVWASTAVIIGSMIGQSIFLVTSQVAQHVGSVSWVLAAWLIGGAIVLLATFCFAELGAALPQAGGQYVYLTRGFGPKWGFLFGWTSALLQGPTAAAWLSAGLLRITAFLLPEVSAPIFTWSIPDPFQPQPYHFTFIAAQLWATAAIAGVTGINYLGIRTAGRFQIMVTGLKIAAIVLIIVLGLTPHNAGGMPISAGYSAPVHGGLGEFLMALVPIMMAYNGFQALGDVGGEIADPQKTIPRTAIVGVVAVVALYFLMNVVYLRVLGFAPVANSQHVGSDAAVKLVGPSGARWLTIVMIVSALGSLHINFLARPRVLYALARDGRFFSFAKRIHPNFHTPSGALLFHGCLAAALVLTGTFEEIYFLGIFSIWIFIALTAVALIRLRKKEPELFRPYRRGAIHGHLGSQLPSPSPSQQICGWRDPFVPQSGFL